MFEWFDRVGYDVDIAALQRDFLEVRWHSFADWAREFDWRVLEQTFFPAGVTDRRNPGGSGSQCQFLELRRVTSPLPRDSRSPGNRPCPGTRAGFLQNRRRRMCGSSASGTASATTSRDFSPGSPPALIRARARNGRPDAQAHRPPRGAPRHGTRPPARCSYRRPVRARVRLFTSSARVSTRRASTREPPMTRRRPNARCSRKRRQARPQASSNLPTSLPASMHVTAKSSGSTGCTRRGRTASDRPCARPRTQF